MGRMLNNNVKFDLQVDVKDDLVNALKVRGVPTDRVLDPKFVFCASRGADEKCMGFVVLAPDEQTAEQYLKEKHELKNIHDLLLEGRIEAERLSALSPQALDSAPASSTLRSCCSRNRNAPVHYVFEQNGKRDAVSMLNRLVDALFDYQDPNGNQYHPNLRPLRQLTLRNATPADPKCQETSDDPQP